MSEVEQGQTVEEAPEATESAEDKNERIEQNIELSDAGPCQKHVRVTIPRAEVSRFLDEELKKLVREASVPGFRPGKTPRKLIQKKYQDDAKGTVKAKILGQSLQQIDEDKSVEPLTEPDINIATIELPDEGDFIYEFKVEVRPEFELPDYREIEIKRETREISDKDVEQEIEAFRRRSAKWVESDQPATEGDVLAVDLRIKVDGEATVDTKATVRLGDDLLFNDGKIQNFAKQMVGVKANDSRVLNGELSKEVENEKFAGKPFTAEFVVEKVMHGEIPELNQAFFDAFEVSDLGELKDWVRSVLERRVRQQQLDSMRKQVVDQLLNKTKIDLPNGLLRRQVEYAMRKRILELRESGLSDEEINAHVNSLRQQAIANTAYYLREQFLLARVAEQEKIDIEESDYDKEIESMATQSGESARRVRARIERDNLAGSLMQSLLERKTIERVLEVCKVTETPSTESLTAPSKSASLNLSIAPVAEPEQTDAETKEE